MEIAQSIVQFSNGSTLNTLKTHSVLLDYTQMSYVMNADRTILSLHEFGAFQSIFNDWWTAQETNFGFDEELGVALPVTSFSTPIDRIVLFKLFQTLPYTSNVLEHRLVFSDSFLNKFEALDIFNTATAELQFIQNLP